MGESRLIQLARNEDLISELEAREKRVPMQEDLKARLAMLAGLARHSIQGALSGGSVPEGQTSSVESAWQVRELSVIDRKALLVTLKSRFVRYPERHKIVEWEKVKKKIEANPKSISEILERSKVAEWDRVEDALVKNPMALWSIQRLEESGGEPDVFRADRDWFEIGDCSKESPGPRRGIAYDNAVFLADQWGAELWSKEQYEHPLTIGKYDEVTQSWIGTSGEMRQSGGALCGYLHALGPYVGRADALDQREDRGFRCALRVDWVKEKPRDSFWKKLIK